MSYLAVRGTRMFMVFHEDKPAACSSLEYIDKNYPLFVPRDVQTGLGSVRSPQEGLGNKTERRTVVL